MGGGEGHTREALLLEHGHGGLDRFGFAGDNGHLGRVFVGRNHVAISGLEHRFNRFVGSGYTGHQAFVVDFYRTHFRAAGGCSSQSTVHVQNSRGHERSVFTKRMPGDHVWRVSVGIERSFNRQIGCQHRRLRVLRLLEFVLRFLQFFFAQGRAQDKSGERLATQDIDHGLVGLLPNLSGCGETLNQIGGHADVLTPLTGVHVNGFGLGWHRWLVGQQHTLRLQEAPLFAVHHRLPCQRLALGKFCPRGGDESQAERFGRVKTRTGRLQRFRKTSSFGVVVKQRPVKSDTGQLGLQRFKRVI